MDGMDRPSVLCVDDDRDLAEVVQAVLVDEGYTVSCLYSLEDDALPRAIGRLEPDVVLLDGGSDVEYGPGWGLASTCGVAPPTSSSPFMPCAV